MLEVEPMGGMDRRFGLDEEDEDEALYIGM